MLFRSRHRIAAFVTKIITLNFFDSIKTGLSPSHTAATKIGLARGGVISIGNFDGVHLGHVSLLRRVRQLANDYGTSALAVTFDPHPASILRPENSPLRLMTLERRASIMSDYGIDQLLVCPVTETFLQLSASQFFKSIVVDGLAATAMVEGPNFFFGRGREGTPEVLAELCQKSNVGFEVIQPEHDSQAMISSSRIRDFLENGEVEDANQLLSCPYQICGRVVPGMQRGRVIGFPTANLEDIEVLVPSCGVYGGSVHVEGRTSMAAIHVGPNPTFDDDTSRKIEVHLIDYEGNLYGKELQVDFLFRLRDVVRFTSEIDLVDQLERDVSSVRSRSL